jgi:hypothetical protein
VVVSVVKLVRNDEVKSSSNSDPLGRHGAQDKAQLGSGIGSWLSLDVARRGRRRQEKTSACVTQAERGQGRGEWVSLPGVLFRCLTPLRDGPIELPHRNFDPATRTLRKHNAADAMDEDTVEKKVEGLAERVIAEHEEKRAQELVRSPENYGHMGIHDREGSHQHRAKTS